MSEDRQEGSVIRGIVPARPPEERIAEAKIAEAEANAAAAIIHAVGVEIKTLVESPGIKSTIEDIGRAKVLEAETAKLREEFAAKDRARSAYLAMVLLVFIALFLAGLALLFEANRISKESAVGVVTVAALAWSIVTRKK